MLRDENKYTVTERKVFMTEIVERQQKGELLECFGTGTAVIVSPVKEIEYKGVVYPTLAPNLKIGPISESIRSKILAIQ